MGGVSLRADGRADQGHYTQLSCMTTIPWPGIWALLHTGLGVLLFIFALTTPSTDHDLEPPG
jgi:hypothetical protein